ncbi:MAG: hypothetical protein KAQ78_04785 [Candidatus Latescibacteria bacterium]|nr:hypothetical protein [Candidatus Latescibacterota bacterium]
MLVARILKQIACTAAVMLLIVGCGDESTGPPKTGSVSGKITFVGTQPDSGSVYINAAALYPIMGPTDYYEELEVAPSQTEVTYRLEGMNFGTYAAIAVSWKDRTDPRHTILGMYGTSEAAGDTLPDPVVLSSEFPDVTDIYIVADYGRFAPPAAPATSGTISGTVTLGGTWPSEQVYVVASLSWPMMGMPALSEPLSPDHLDYMIKDLAFGEYNMVGVFTYPAMTMLGRWPDPVTVSADQPVITEIDVVAENE